MKTYKINIRTKLLYLFFLFLPLFGLSQEIDSLYRLWMNANQPDSIRFAAIKQICLDHLAEKYPDSAFSMAQIMFDEANSISDKKYQADALHIKGYTFYVQGDFANAKDYFEKSLKLSLDAGCQKRTAYSYGNIGNIYKVQGNFTRALEYLEKSLVINKSIGDRKELASNNNDMGRLHLSEGAYQKALKYFKQSLELRKEIDDKQGIAWSYNNIGFTYLKIKDFTQALSFIEQSLQVNKEIYYKTGIAYNYNNLGLIYLQMELFTESLVYFHRSKEIFESASNKFGMSMVSVNIGEANLKLKKPGEGLTWCQEGFDMATEIGALEEEIKACDCLYKANKELGKSADALVAYELLIQLKEELHNNEFDIKLQEIEFNRERLADSLAMTEARYKSDLDYQERLSKAQTTRNTMMLSGLGILLLAGGLFSRILYIRKTNKELELKNSIIAREKEKAEESEHLKEQFFNNVSHEFRTPITLILGPLDEALQKTEDQKTKADLTIAKRNAQRLESMIDELLDLSKLEFGKIKLEAKEVEIVGMISEHLHSFESLANQRKMSLDLESAEETLHVYIDSDKILKVLNNLLFNACKFTGDGGNIKVRIKKIDMFSDHASSENSSPAQPVIQISVTDTGIGFPKDQVNKIFDRFYQVRGTKSNHGQGTGIGLALAKELVELHHGKIWAESEPGKGAIFTFILPLGRDHLFQEEITEEEKKEDNNWIIEKEISGQEKDAGTFEEADFHSDLPIILIVEDNEDMRSFIKRKIEDLSNVIEAGNGEEGYNKATEHIPDLIICDIMMPVMDGIELTRKLKNDERTSHIPVMLLTARASTESKIEGLETGADAYVTKPFNIQVLVVRAKKLIEQRNKLRAHFSKKLESIDEHLSEDPELPSMDKQFLDKAVHVVTEHISDKDFDANTFSSEMAMSRVQLHRKLTAITGKTTTEFIRTLRLNRAARLMKSHTGNITEIALEVGIGSQSYFSKIFKEHFGLTPSEFLEDS